LHRAPQPISTHFFAVKCKLDLFAALTAKLIFLNARQNPWWPNNKVYCWVYHINYFVIPISLQSTTERSKSNVKFKIYHLFCKHFRSFKEYQLA